MRIQSNDRIAGQPVLAIRKLMRHGRNFGPPTEGNSLDDIATILQIDLFIAKQVFQTLCTEGYIEPTCQTNPSRGDTEHWYTTVKGNALAGATARKPITRRTADKQIEKFLARVKEINADNEYAYRVKQVILFGSYLSESSTLGDIDLSITLERRYSDQEMQSCVSKARIKHALEQGRDFPRYLDQLAWPEVEVWRILKRHSPSLSLHDETQEQILLHFSPTKILFDDSEEPPT